MAKTASWRDASKKTKAGLIPQYRLQLPHGEAVLALPRDYPFSQNDMGDECFELRCFALGLRGVTTNERNEEKAKKVALEILQKYINELVQKSNDNLEAIRNIQVKERERKKEAANSPTPVQRKVSTGTAVKAEPKAETKTRKPRGSAKAKTDASAEVKPETKSKRKTKTTTEVKLPKTPKKRGRQPKR